MTVQNQTLVYETFNRGLNKRDNELTLEQGETPRAQNVQISRKKGLKKSEGITAKFTADVASHYDGIFAYTDGFNKFKYIAYDYPNIRSIDPISGARVTLNDGLIGTGSPEACETSDGQLFIVDSVNAPRLISETTVTTVSWPPSYTHDNNADGNVDNSYLAATTNPTSSDIGIPKTCAFFKNRIVLADTKNRRLYFSRVMEFGDFNNNDPLEINIAFFLDIDTKSDIVALRVLSNENLVVYCEENIVVMTGDNPPGTLYPQPHFAFQELNSEIGAMSSSLIVQKGDNDHYFVSNKGVLTQLTLAENFQQVRPLGLSEKIFPVLEGVDKKTFRRGFLLNNYKRSEIWWGFPSASHKKYADQVYVMNYGFGAGPEESRWVPKKELGALKLYGGVTDRNTGDLMLFNDRKIFNIDSGFSYDGNAIITKYQLPTFDFGAPEYNKDIAWITFYVRSTTGATIGVNHLWENGESGYTTFNIPAQMDSEYGSANWTDDSSGNYYTSDAGEGFSAVEVYLANPIGKLLKMTLKHTGTAEDFEIQSMRINYRVFGKK